jgi:hypothetical protein
MWSFYNTQEMRSAIMPVRRYPISVGTLIFVNRKFTKVERAKIITISFKTIILKPEMVEIFTFFTKDLIHF